MQFSNAEDKKMLRIIRTNYIHTSAHYSNRIKILGVMYAPHNPHKDYFTRVRELNKG